VDFNTEAGTRGCFARICVQLDLEQPLTRTIRVGKLKLAVVYEGIGLLCFHYGRIGHRCEWCPNRIQEEVVTPEDAPSVPDLKEEEKSSEFGPWMLVTCRKKQTKTAGVRDDGRISPGRANGNGGQGRDFSGAAVKGRGRGFSDAEVKVNGRQLSKASFHPLDKGKKNLDAGLSEEPSPKLYENLNEPSPKISEQHFTAGPSKPVFIQNPVFTFNITSPLKSSLQSQPSKTLAFSKIKPNLNPSPQQPPSSTSPIRPQAPHSKAPQTKAPQSKAPQSKGHHDKHSLGDFSAVQRTSKLEDSIRTSGNSDKRRCDKIDSEGSPSHMGLVRRRDSSGLVQNSSSSPTRRLSRSPSPNRHGLVARDKSVLEFPHGCPEDRRDSLSTTDTLSAIARVAICPISGGSLLCNTSRIRRKESLVVSPNPLQLGRQSDITQISSDSEVYPSVRVRDPLLGVEGEGIPRVSIHLEDDPKQLMGNVAGEGMELARSGGSAFPNQ
jgi:hypothetical protein